MLFVIVNASLHLKNIVIQNLEGLHSSYEQMACEDFLF